MTQYLIDTKESLDDFLEYVKDIPTCIPKVNENKITFNGDEFEVIPKYSYILRRFNNDSNKLPSVNTSSSHNDDNISDSQKLIFGKDETEKIVAIETVDDEILLFKNDGSIERRPNEYWILSSRSLGVGSERLDGNLFYKYKKTFSDYKNYNEAKSILYKRRTPIYTVSDPVEASMITNGYTFFKGLKVDEVSVLSIDIETTGVVHDKDSKVLLISNTFRDKSGKLKRKLFSLDEYDDEQGSMIANWVSWVQEVDPSIIIGHNVFGFDLPYLSFCYKKYSNEDLELGRNCAEIEYSKKPKKFRKDGQQSYDYFEAKIFGRQIIDTWMLSIKYDFKRAYPTYKLKDIVEYEGLERKGRIKWNFEDKKAIDVYKAGGKDWDDFKEYCKDDADDSLKLYDLMIPQFFYYMRSIPMPFQTMNLTATGRQINGLLIRSYLQDNHSIPQASEYSSYSGGISAGFPGVYDNVYKVDVASLYPSIMITEKVFDPNKDPNANFLKMVKTFTKERLENKRLGKETGDRYYKDLEQGQKIVINSAYGLLGAKGLHFNNIELADKVTTKGREILQKGVEWATGFQLKQIPRLLKSGKPKTNANGEVMMHWVPGEKISEGKGYELVNVDTDSFSYRPKKKLTNEQFQQEIEELNLLYKDGITWEDDGYFKKVIVFKAKNYVLWDGKKIKTKGQALKATGKEKSLQNFIKCVIMLLLTNKRDHIMHEYQQIAKEIKRDWNPEEWSMKVSVTKAVLNPERKQEQKILDAIEGKNFKEGDKVYLFSKDSDTLVLKEDYKGEYDEDIYFNKLFNTLKVFETVFDTTLFPNYKLGRNKDLI
jgi:DNA polymerase elongation subunit (family B)